MSTESQEDAVPLITAKMFEGRLDADTEPRVVAALTDALVSVFGEEIRDQTWIILEEVPRSRWGFGGQTAVGG
jgi:4-oxalocrotonate tautomerase